MKTNRKNRRKGHRNAFCAHSQRKFQQKKRRLSTVFAPFYGNLQEFKYFGKNKAFPLGGRCLRQQTDEGRSLFSNCLSKVTLQKKLSASFQGFPLLHFAQRKIQQKLSASFRGFPSGGSSLRSKVMRGAAHYAKPIFDCLNIFDKKFQKNQGAQHTMQSPFLFSEYF